MSVGFIETSEKSNESKPFHSAMSSTNYISYNKIELATDVYWNR